MIPQARGPVKKSSKFPSRGAPFTHPILLRYSIKSAARKETALVEQIDGAMRIRDWGTEHAM
jgi:hypothetical protein